MRRTFYAAIVALVCLQAGKATAQFTGEDCHGWPDAGYRALYMLAFIDGIMASETFNLWRIRESDGDFIGNSTGRLLECMLGEDGKGTTGKQLGAVLKKWLDENPEQWRESCGASAMQALQQLCGIGILRPFRRPCPGRPDC